MFESSSQGFFLFDDSGKVISANPAVQEIFGLPLETIRDKPLIHPGLNMINLHENSFPAEDNPVLTVLKTGKPVRNVVIGVRASETEKYRWLNVCSFPVTQPGSKKPSYVYSVIDDITHRISAEQELRKKSEIFQTYFDTAPLIIVCLDSGFKVSLVNNHGCELLEYSKSEIIGTNWFDKFVPRDIRDELKERFGKIAKGTADPVSRLEYAVLTKSDERREIKWTFTPLRDGTGEITGILCTGEDATLQYRKEKEQKEYRRQLELLVQERTAKLRNTILQLENEVLKHTEASTLLQETEAKIRNLMDTIFDGIIVVNEDGNIVMVNEQIENLFGYSKDELIDQPLKILIPERFRQTHETHCAAFISNPKTRPMKIDFELCAMRKDGSEFPCTVGLSFITINDNLFISAIIRDITVQKKTEQSLKKNEALFRSLFENSSIPLIELDYSQVKKFINDLELQSSDELEKYFDTHPQALQKAHSCLSFRNVNKATVAFWQAADADDFIQKFYNILTPETLDTVKRIFLSLNQGKTEFSCITSTKTFKGETKTISLKISVLPGHEKSLSGIIVSAIDITELKKIQNELTLHKTNLEELVKERTQQLEKEIAERKKIELELHKRDKRLQRQNEYLSELSSNKILMSGNLTAALGKINRACAAALEVERVSVWIFDESFAKIKCFDLFEKRKDHHSKNQILAAKDFPAYFKEILQDHLIDADDALQDPRTKEFSETYLKPLGITSMLDIPIRVEGGLKGIVCIEHIGKARHWEIDEKNFARAISEIISLAFEAYDRRQAEIQLILEEQRLESLFKLSQMKDIYEAELIEFGIEEAVKLTESQAGYFHLLNPDQQSIQLHRWSTVKSGDDLPPEPAPILITEFESWTKCVQQQKPVINNNERQIKDLFPKSQVVLTQHLCIPVIKNGRVVAIAGVANDLRNYDGDDVRHLAIFMSSFWEIIERKRIEETVNRLALIVESSEDAIIGKTLTGIVTSWNKSAEKLYGYSSDEVLGKHISLIIPSDCQHELELILQKVKKGQKVEHYETTRIKKDGEKIDVSLTISPIKDSAGRIIGASAIDRDISKRKRADILLKKAKQEAEKANRLKSEFLATMSHEIRTPLNAIIGLNYLLQFTKLNPKQREYLTKMQIASQSLLNLISDILDFSKIEAGKLDIETIDFKINEVFDRLTTVVGLKAREKGLEIFFKIDPKLPFQLKGDPNRLYQVLLNLTNNAIKFTEHGSVILTAELAQKTSGRVTLKFSVKDTGMGIPKEKLRTIFAPFVQSEASTTRRYGGSGLGLSISKRLVEMMGGEIWVKSKVDKGSTFYFTTNFEYYDKNIKDFLQPPVAVKGLRILVVDDNKDIRETIAEQLKSLSFVVKVVSSVQEAITELHGALTTGKRFYDLILMDWNLNGKNGLLGAKLIKTDHEIAHQPKIILMSGFMLRESINGEDHKYFDLFLIKPFSISMLFNAILEVFGQEVLDDYKVNLPVISLPMGLSKIKNAKILVVEDNPFNQLVVKDMLENEELNVTVVENGLCAVNILNGVEKKEGFDLVLMDLQMPVMDGLEATKKIRKNKNLKNLPILALTADVVGGVIQRCFKAGMNDHIRKPVDPEELFSKLVKWIPPTQQQNEVSDIAKKEIPRESESFPMLPGLDVETGIRSLNYKQELYQRLLLKFKESQKDFIGSFKKAIYRADIELAARLAHTLKGTSGNLRANNLYKAAQELEKVIKEGKSSMLSEALKNVEEELSIVFDSIQKYVADNEAHRPPKSVNILSINELLTGLERLQKFLADNDTEAVEEFEKLSSSLNSHGFGELSEQLKTFIEKYDFEHSAEIVNFLLKQIKG
ncbi:MAG: PAS domain S-box protein [Calditrichaeota bacterium]|nr:PAS domain S-box protein [Calditrichota bacterium]